MINNNIFRTACIVSYLLIGLRIAAQESQKPLQHEAEQLLDYMRSRKNHSLEAGMPGGLYQDKKCGFWINGKLQNNWNNYSPLQQEELVTLMKAAAAQKDTIAGHFRIFYDTVGIDAPSLIDQYHNSIPGSAKAYIDSVVSIFNHVWEVEIGQMGYAAPPLDTNQLYDIYVRDLSVYGATYALYPPINGADNPPRYRSYIEIDNDFKEVADYYTYGMEALKVTAAHEFHHAIQFGYGFWMNDTYAYEITSTWFEDILYDGVNDYYNYLGSYFNGFNNGLQFNSSLYGGYERCIWAHYLAKRFGPSLMLDVWNEMRNRPFLQSTQTVLLNWGSDIQSAFAEFTYWNFFTADRADPVKYYPEGENFPRFRPLRQTPFSGGTSMTNSNVYELSSSIYEFCSPSDTLNIIIANVDIESAKLEANTQQRIDITLSTGPLSQPYTNLKNGSKVKISFTNDPLLWRYFFSQEITSVFAAPNPFYPAFSKRLILNLGEERAKTADVYFYTSSLDLAYSRSFEVVNESGLRAVIIPASELQSKLSSGIYFIFAKTSNSNYKWKLAVIR